MSKCQCDNNHLKPLTGTGPVIPVMGAIGCNCADTEGELVWDSLVPLRTFPTTEQADLAKATLDAAGITTIVEGDDCGGQFPPLSLVTGGISLSCWQSEVNDAKCLLDSPPPAEIDSLSMKK